MGAKLKIFVKIPKKFVYCAQNFFIFIIVFLKTAKYLFQPTSLGKSWKWIKGEGRHESTTKKTSFKIKQRTSLSTKKSFKKRKEETALTTKKKMINSHLSIPPYVTCIVRICESFPACVFPIHYNNPSTAYVGEKNCACMIYQWTVIPID